MLLINTQALPDLGSKDLLVHCVPVAVPYLELTRIFPGTPEIHDHIKVKGDLSSTFVKFKNSKEAEGAYEALNGMISQKDIRVSGSGNVSATLVEFRNAKEAEMAFEDLDGDLNQVIY
ncbi:hypothetical protein FCM35_KLT09468 [Carex littledalei]|uniref:RRM domain-containing protein n=1 Tax=Carex littledalei TaxID=544730 RepID=A0A833RY32_9POAL|nr:hypothetical protein FCM35_KLT09468 [Carex littledalei]